LYGVHIVLKPHLSSDPIEGARRGFFALNVGAADEDWERRVAKHSSDAEYGFDDYRALAGLCRQALAEVDDLSPELREHLAYSMGVFEGLNQLVGVMWLTMPVSRHAPKHLTRHRRQLAISVLHLADEPETEI
jgi:hypothetical protein